MTKYSFDSRNLDNRVSDATRHTGNTRNESPIVKVPAMEQPFPTIGQGNRNNAPIVAVPAMLKGFGTDIENYTRDVTTSDVKKIRDAQRLFMPSDTQSDPDSGGFGSMIKG